MRVSVVPFPYMPSLHEQEQLFLRFSVIYIAVMQFVLVYTCESYISPCSFLHFLLCP
jgi:hypothetical protein